MPLVSSVSEHAPSTWPTYFREINVLLIFVPVGFYYALMPKMTHGSLFVAMYSVFTVYFASAMNRLMIVFAPAVCILAAIGVSKIIRMATKSIRFALIGQDHLN